MHGVWHKHLGLWLVFAAGVACAVYGVFLLVGGDVELDGVVEAVGGLGLVAWVMFHPARVAEGARAER